jgi:hypothetical protein
MRRRTGKDYPVSVFLCLLLCVAILTACGINEGTSVSYEALVNPGDRIGFRTLANLRTYAANNTATTQSDATALSDTFGVRIAGGTHVHVIATSDLPEGDRLHSDTKACKVEPSPGEKSLWLECWDLRRVSKRVADAHEAGTTTNLLPTVGDLEKTTRAHLAGFETPKDTDLEDTYIVPLDGAKVRLWFGFSSSYRDGTKRLSQLSLSAVDSSLDASLENKLFGIAVPHDAVKVPKSSVSALLVADAEGNPAGDSLDFYSSKSLAREVQDRTYNDHGTWRTGTCPRSPPSIIEVYKARDETGRVKKLTVTAMYVLRCQE